MYTLIYIYIDWCDLTIKGQQANFLQIVGWSCKEKSKKCMIFRVVPRHLQTFGGSASLLGSSRSLLGWSASVLG